MNDPFFNFLKVVWTVASIIWFYQFVKAALDLNGLSPLRIGFKFALIFVAINTFDWLFYSGIHKNFVSFIFSIISFFLIIGGLGSLVLAGVTFSIRFIKSKFK